MPKASETWGSVTEVRVEYGDLVVMIEVPAFMITISFLASAEMSGMIRPILIVFCASAATVAARKAATAAAMILIWAPPCLPCGCLARQSALFC